MEEETEIQAPPSPEERLASRVRNGVTYLQSDAERVKKVIEESRVQRVHKAVRRLKQRLLSETRRGSVSWQNVKDAFYDYENSPAFEDAVNDDRQASV